jgi:hypothetical protein
MRARDSQSSKSSVYGMLICDCGMDLSGIAGVVNCRCGRIVFSDGVDKVVRRMPVVNVTVDDAGRTAWKALHDYADSQEWNPVEARQWYRHVWTPMIPRYCGCVTHWKEITDKLPPDFSSREAFRAWAIAAHNEVNKRLGKPVWSET